MKRTRSRGFTLVEVLVVVAIMAALASIILPVFARVRESGRRTVCASNLKQIALAMQQYVGDNDGRYPTAHMGINWQYLVLPYIKATQVFRCPSVVADEPLPPPVGSSYLSLPQHYSYNGVRVFPFRVGKHESALSSHTSAIWLNASIDFSPNRVATAPTCGKASLPLVASFAHHSGGTNYSFLDGRVKWLRPEQMAEIECSNPAPDSAP